MKMLRKINEHKEKEILSIIIKKCCVYQKKMFLNMTHKNMVIGKYMYYLIKENNEDEVEYF